MRPPTSLFRIGVLQNAYRRGEQRCFSKTTFPRASAPAIPPPRLNAGYFSSNGLLRRLTSRQDAGPSRNTANPSAIGGRLDPSAPENDTSQAPGQHANAHLLPTDDGKPRDKRLPAHQAHPPARRPRHKMTRHCPLMPPPYSLASRLSSPATLFRRTFSALLSSQNPASPC